MTEPAGPTRGRAWAAALRTGWGLAAGGAGGTGIVAALFLPTPVSPAGVFIGGAALAVAMTLPFAEQPSARPWRWLELALVAGVAAVALQGLTTWIGWSILPLVGLLAATCPWIVEAVLRLWDRASPAARWTGPAAAVRPSVTTGAGPDMSLFEVMLEEAGPLPGVGEDEPEAPDDPTLHTLDVDQLCRLWLGSFARLREARTSELVLAVTRERDNLLRELARRDPEGVAAWLADRPRATGDPRRYLRRTQGG